MIENVVLSHQVPENWRAQSEVFSEIFFVFLVVGAVVGTVVIAYTLHHVYKYRDTDESAAPDEAGDEGFERPRVGELPRGQSGAKSKKLFVSFALSAIIVISLVVYSYGLLLYVEAGPSSEIGETDADENMDIEVTGIQFNWIFEYPNGQQEFGTLRVPQGEDQVIRLHVTSDDVWHTFGVTELRVKADSIPGQTDTTWFIADEVGTYEIECFELCGSGHSQMVGQIEVMEEEEFNEWYEGEDENGNDDTDENGETNDNGGDGEEGEN